MAPRFDSFVILAGMRTGSNLLEAKINLIADVTSHGEAFNPVFVGFPKTNQILGMDAPTRDADPHALLDLIQSAPGLNGFRYFNDHDPRVFDAIIADPRCAKIVLTRNPAESYVSLSIARKTGQWKLGDAKARRAEKAEFDAAEFETYLTELQDFQRRILHGLQSSGQTAFYIDYDDLQDEAVLTGLAAFLGHQGGIPEGDVGIVPQNPESIDNKVANFEEMAHVLARLDRFNLSRTPNFEPRRGPGVPGFIGSDRLGLLAMPLRGASDRSLPDWLAEADPEGRSEGFNQRGLRDWLAARPGHHRLTILRHPLLRAWIAFERRILSNKLEEARAVMTRRYDVALPKPGREADLSAADMTTAFLGFLRFIKSNLAAQTQIRTDLSWASQSEILRGFAQFTPPDMILREDQAAPVLADLARAAGLPDAPAFDPPEARQAAKSLARIMDPRLNAAARDAYPRDYALLGFDDWQP